MIALVKIHCTSNFAANRAAIQTSLRMSSLNGPGRTVDDLVPLRAKTDAIRTGLSHLLDGCPTIQHDSKALRIIRAEAKTSNPKDIRLDLHFQARGSSVNYLHLGYFYYNSTYRDITWTYSDDLPYELKDSIPSDLKDIISAPWELQALGEKAFRQDIDRLVERLLTQNLPKLWAGTWLVADQTLMTVAKTVRLLLNNISDAARGKASLNIITLEDNQENRETLGAELSETLTKELQGLRKDFEALNPSDLKFQVKKDRILAELATHSKESSAIRDRLRVEFSTEYWDTLIEVSDLLA